MHGVTWKAGHEDQSPKPEVGGSSPPCPAAILGKAGFSDQEDGPLLSAVRQLSILLATTQSATLVEVMAARREIPQRELRNNVSAVLREVESGETVRVTVRGRPVAELVPISPRKEHLSPADVERITRDAPLDPGFSTDVEDVAGATIDEL
jgi:prevent-host-death family protein